MRNSKLTKLVALAAVLALSVAGLAGSTVAWFTDTETSLNTIQSGSLDIEWQYYDEDSTADDKWTAIEANESLFNDKELYEPGYTEVVYLKVKNAGDLALQYKLNLNAWNEKIGTAKDGTTAISLTDHLKAVAMVMEGDTFTAYTDRKTAREEIAGYYPDGETTTDTATATNLPFISEGTALTAPVGENADSYKEFSDETGYAVSMLEDSKLMPGETGSEIIAVMIYMPEGVGNEANHKPGAEYKPQIKFGLNLEAAQLVSESDSFDELYDASAQYADGSAVGITKPGYVPPEGSSRKAITSFPELKYYIEDKSTHVAEGGYATSLSTSGNIDFAEAGESAEVKVDDKIYVYWSPYSEFTNNTGNVTFNVEKDGEINFGGNSQTLGVMNFAGAGNVEVNKSDVTAIIASGNVTVDMTNVTINDKITVNENAKVNMSQCSIRPHDNYTETTSLEVNGGTVTVTNNKSLNGNIDLNGGELNLVNCNSTGSKGINVAAGATLNIENSIIGGMATMNVAADAKLNINGGTINYKITVADGAIVSITGGEFIKNMNSTDYNYTEFSLLKYVNTELYEVNDDGNYWVVSPKA